MEAESTLHVFATHKGRVKRLAVAEDEPHLLFSACEDGSIMQFDLRCPEVYADEDGRSVLINLNHYLGQTCEAKCLDICPTRTELLAVGASDPFARLYDRRMIRCTPAIAPDYMINSDHEQYSIPANCVRYFVPGHVPAKIEDYIRRYRSLAATYITFSPDGQDLLVNLGGEQIYLYHVSDESRSYRLEIPESGGSSMETEDRKPDCSESSDSIGIPHTNGYHSQSSGYTPFILRADNLLPSSPQPNSVLPPNVELIKQRANHNYERQNYAESISLYNRAIHLHPTAAVLYSNRAAALLKRDWNGDAYAALNDCIRSIQLNRDQHKAYYRLCRCLITLGRLEEAGVAVTFFECAFPDRAIGHSFEKLKQDLNESKRRKSKKRHMWDDDSPGEKVKEIKINEEQEKVFRREAYDYTLRFCGHCNTTTDIKEANFIGDDAQYVCAGSDDGSFFIWDRQTTNIVRTLRGDECIVNCVQPHPNICLLATSGIDPVVRLWAPLAEGVKNERWIDNSHAAATLNQRRMNADPLEVMLMNMGHTITGGRPDHDSENRGDMACRPF